MPLFRMPTEELRHQIQRLLTEYAERTHAGDCDSIDVRFLFAQSVMGGLNFAPRPDLLTTGVDQAAHERTVLAHWLALVPDLDDVTVVVRRYGRPVRTLVLEPTTACPSDETARER